MFKPTVTDRGNSGSNRGIRLLNREHPGAATGIWECNFLWGTNVPVHSGKLGIPARFNREIPGLKLHMTSRLNTHCLPI